MFDCINDYVSWLSKHDKYYKTNYNYRFFDGDKELVSNVSDLQKFKDLSVGAASLDLLFTGKKFPLKIRACSVIYIDNKSLLSLKGLNISENFLTSVSPSFSPSPIRYCFHTWNNALDVRELYSERNSLSLEFHDLQEMKYQFPINQQYKCLRFVECVDQKLYDMNFYDTQSDIEKIVFDSPKYDFVNLMNLFLNDKLKDFVVYYDDRDMKTIGQMYDKKMFDEILEIFFRRGNKKDYMMDFVLQMQEHNLEYMI